MAEVWVQRWTKASDDRLHATLPDGTSIGWMNLGTGDIKFDLRAHREEAQFALATVARSKNLPIDDEVQRIQIPSDGDMAAAPWATSHADRSEVWASFNRTLQGPDDVRTYPRGDRLGRSMGPTLRRLHRDGWKALHSPPSEDPSTIHHLLIGPRSVAVLNAQHYEQAKISVTTNAIYVDGAPTDHVAQARQQAHDASATLTALVGFHVDVTPCVVIDQGSYMRGHDIKRSGTPFGVVIATPYSLPRLLEEAEGGLSPQQTDTIYEAARKSTAWV